MYFYYIRVFKKDQSIQKNTFYLLLKTRHLLTTSLLEVHESRHGRICHRLCRTRMTPSGCDWRECDMRHETRIVFILSIYISARYASVHSDVSF